MYSLQPQALRGQFWLQDWVQVILVRPQLNLKIAMAVCPCGLCKTAPRSSGGHCSPYYDVSLGNSSNGPHTYNYSGQGFSVYRPPSQANMLHTHSAQLAQATCLYIQALLRHGRREQVEMSRSTSQQPEGRQVPVREWEGELKSKAGLVPTAPGSAPGSPSCSPPPQRQQCSTPGPAHSGPHATQWLGTWLGTRAAHS